MKKKIIITIISAILIMTGTQVKAATNVTVNSWGHNLGYYTGTADNPIYNTTGWFTGDKTLPAGNLGLYLDSLRVIYTNPLSTANTYNITFDSYYNPRSGLDIFKRARIVFTGSSTGSNSGTSEAAIKNGVCIPGISEGTATKVTWSCSFQPTIALNYMRVEIYFDNLYYMQSYGCLKPVVIFDNAQVDAITNQTLVINQKTQEIIDILKEEVIYNTNPSETIDGQNELDNMEESEESLFDDLDFSGLENIDITINTNTSSFIWQIVDLLRSINTKIVVLMTSVLGLGIIKMILNR